MFTYDYPYREAFVDARNHAREQYPNESCGVIVGGKYIRCQNVAEDPTKDFAIAPTELARFSVTGIDMVVHSHPNGPYFPSVHDMQSQMQTDVPWAIIVLDEERTNEVPVIWGTKEPILPILGRPFVHGVADCYSMVRDVFRLGREKLAEQDIHWPLPPIELYDLPRQDAWWKYGDNFYVDHYAKQGFRIVSPEEARPGDCFLTKIRSEVCNHAGVFLEDETIAHHLPMRVSRREPAGLWARAAELILRYEGPNA